MNYSENSVELTKILNKMHSTFLEMLPQCLINMLYESLVIKENLFIMKYISIKIFFFIWKYKLFRDGRVEHSISHSQLHTFQNFWAL